MSTSNIMFFVSSAGLQQYPAMGLVFFARGTDLGMLSTFSQSVFKIFEGIEMLLLTRVDADGITEAGGVQVGILDWDRDAESAGT